jgi:ATP-dependent exoDNAse (exonuclease V) alpha subunit
MEGLLKLAEREDARILFSGDTRQLQSVEASDALRILEQESRMKSVSLTAVQRQTPAQYRDAIQTLRHSPEQGSEKLEQLGAVREVPYGGRIHLEDGRTLPANYHEFDHGYAVTAHRSQGKTVDAVILSADAMKQELFYVGASRGRQEIVVVTSDREQLRDLLGISTALPSATELARQQTPFSPHQCSAVSSRYCSPLNRRCCEKRMATSTIWE